LFVSIDWIFIREKKNDDKWIESYFY